MASEKVLRAAAVELSDVLGLEPAINSKAKLSVLTKEVEEAVALINSAEGDSPEKFSETTLAVILEINPDAFPEEEEKPKKPIRKPAKKEEVEEEEEEDEALKKPAKKPAKPAPVEEEEEQEEDEKPAKKPVKKGSGASPFTSTKETLGTTRMIEVAKAMQTIKGAQSVDAIAATANKNFMKAGGKDNVKQSKNIIKVLLPAAIEWDIVNQDKKGNLSNG